ncbi:hypothetical protein N7535_001118 [Penicillium sp. DV-2018c]|nr:hypothetical protein N7461_005642 [Penicillium sp. DV-2018c]KAJ5582498.1 hypothetical protein N7535_001118 [Penicillium sp. DV-2018c]
METAFAAVKGVLTYSGTGRAPKYIVFHTNLRLRSLSQIFKILQSQLEKHTTHFFQDRDKIANLLKAFFEVDRHPIKIPQQFCEAYVEWLKSDIIDDESASMALVSYCGQLLHKHRTVESHADGKSTSQLSGDYANAPGKMFDHGMHSAEEKWIVDKIGAMGALRSKIGKGPDTSPSTIFAVICLAANELLESNIFAFNVHSKALKLLVHRYGF